MVSRLRVVSTHPHQGKVSRSWLLLRAPAVGLGQRMDEAWGQAEGNPTLSLTNESGRACSASPEENPNLNVETVCGCNGYVMLPEQNRNVFSAIGDTRQLGHGVE